MPADGLCILGDYDSILFGAVGFPPVPDHISLWGLLLPIRQSFDQYINLRPVKLLPGVPGPLRNKGPKDIDFVCIRENTEGEYSGVGGRAHRGMANEVAVQTSVFTRAGVERVLRYGFELARKRPRHELVSATKSNALQYSMVFWDEVFAQLQERVSRRRLPAVSRRCPGGTFYHRAGEPGCGGGLKPVWGYPHRPGRRAAGQPGHPAQRQHQPGAALSLAL